MKPAFVPREAQILQLAAHLAERAAQANSIHRCLTVGLCGAQGSGKSTLTLALKELLEARGLAVAALSIDDLYLGREARLALSKSVHPLLQTRGVPGTHDVGLGMEVLAALRQPGVVALPAFEKARDDRRPRHEWPTVEGPMQVILFEGWCVGAKPEAAESLARSINSLEQDEDADGIWRRYVNAALAGEYQRLFAPIDVLVFLQAPNFDVVHRWRVQQEEALRQEVAAKGGDGSRLMTDAQIARFISHYERLTRHILAEMPSRADAMIKLGPHREMTIAFRSPSASEVAT